MQGELGVPHLERFQSGEQLVALVLALLEVPEQRLAAQQAAVLPQLLIVDAERIPRLFGAGKDVPALQVGAGVW